MDEITRLKAERDAYKQIAEGQAKLLCCYRLGLRKSEAALNLIEKANRKLQALANTA